jgi:hypothetical protein
MSLIMAALHDIAAVDVAQLCLSRPGRRDQVGVTKPAMAKPANGQAGIATSA